MDSSTGADGRPVSERVRSARMRRGKSQRKLAEDSGVSLSAIRSIEQGTYGTPRPATLRKLAAALNVPTSALMESPPQARPQEPSALWAPAREAILHPVAASPQPDEGIEEDLAIAVRLYAANRYGELAAALPPLLAASAGAPPLPRSRVMQLAGSVMTQTRQRDAARVALDGSLAAAQEAGSTLDAASAVITQCWLLLLEHDYGRVRHLSAEWADRVEPRLSSATLPELSAWGWLLLRGSAAAIRDNEPGEAADMMRLAEAAAVTAGAEQAGWRRYWTTFGPATVAMKRVENAVVEGKPDVALRLAETVPRGLRPTSDNRNRHLLDVCAANLDLRRTDEALGVMRQLAAEAGPWLAEQNMARDLTGRILRRRRTLTGEMRELADAVRLPL